VSSDGGPLVDVVIMEYDPLWPRQFEAVEMRLRSALGAAARTVLHVGSTAVPGLGAKPIIDVNLLVDDASDEDSYRSALEEAGFEFRLRQPEWHQHRLFRGSDPRSNVHVFSVGCSESDRMVIFRDWLRDNPSDRTKYEQTKRDLASRQWPTVQDYADAKTDVVLEILGDAQD
jgi:GrpB-like predicted nucleotidyltransferase (UPF0157 family)